jgi:AcrR family transcriptional regulator
MYVKNDNVEHKTQEERRAATRRALLGAARGLFAEGGYHATAAGEVVGRAGLTRGAMYHHFEDKRDLFRAVVEEVEAEVDGIILAEARRALEETSSQWEAFRAGHRAYLDACLRPEVRRVLLVDGPAVLGWEEWHEIDAAHAVRQIQAGLEAMMESGMMEPGPTGPLAHLLHGAVLEAALYVAVCEDPASARDEVWDGLERLLKGLLDNDGTG